MAIGSKLSAVKKAGFHKACDGVWVQLQKADTKKIQQVLEQVRPFLSISFQVRFHWIYYVRLVALLEVIQRWMNRIDTLSIQLIINPNGQFWEN